MRALLYKLADGTTVKTLAEAQNSGQKYEEYLKKVDLEKTTLQDYEKESDET